MRVLFEPSTASEGKRNAKEPSEILAFWIRVSPGVATSNQKTTCCLSAPCAPQEDWQGPEDHTGCKSVPLIVIKENGRLLSALRTPPGLPGWFASMGVLYRYP